MKTRDIVNIIESFAHPGIQESWDNSGLIIGDPDTDINGLMVRSGDATDAVTNNDQYHVSDRTAWGGFRLRKIVSGSVTNLDTSADDYTDGDILYLEADGSSIDVQLNASSILSATDSAISSGYGGVIMAPAVTYSTAYQDDFTLYDDSPAANVPVTMHHYTKNLA
jgi:hypothetical protein